MARADLDWANLGFGYLKTDKNIRYTWKEGAWDSGVLVSEEHIALHMAATSLHYGQEAFEGLKVFEQKNGDTVAFRIDENAKRLARSCQQIFMEPVPEDMFVEAVFRVVNANRRFIPPYGTGASLYVRPVVIGSGPQVGVKPAEEFLFLVFVTPVGPYFKTGFKPVDMVIEEEFDRAAPGGVGNVKVGGNYAAGMLGTVEARNAGYGEALYLDAQKREYIEELGAANFFGITKEKAYVTPKSPAILRSITNLSLRTLAADMGYTVEERPVPVTELQDFIETGACGTAAVITPIELIRYGEEEIVYLKDGKPGPHCTALYERLTGIQYGDLEDKFGWTEEIKL